MCEMPSCCKESTPKARKCHKCCECRGWIEPGETYTYLTGIWDASAYTFKTCTDCQALREEISKGLELAYDEPIPLGMLQEEINDLPEALRFIAIKEKRGAVVHESWHELVARLRAPVAGKREAE